VHRSDDGSLPRDIVLDVLRAFDVGVSVASPPGGEADLQVTIVGCNGENLAVYPLGEVVRKRMIHTFARLYGVQIHYFYNPDMIK